MTSVGVACSGGGGSSDSGPATDARQGACGSGLQAHGPACGPIFDTCRDDEVPRLGGGCKRVGVRECDGGLMAPPDWTCRRIGPPATCLGGWAKVEGGWCEPVLPAQPCPAGSIEVIGQAQCQPIGDCGSGTYGALKPGAATLHVDGAYTGGGSDGSASKPYTTVGAALQAAASGARLAVAAGVYAEDLVIDRPITIEGRCAKLVTLEGQGAPAAVSITAGPATLRGLSVTGPAGGIRIDGAKAALERVAVQACGAAGIAARGGAEVEADDCVVAGSLGVGLLVEDAAARLERSVVRETRSPPTMLPHGDRGQGIRAVRDRRATTLTLVDSLVSANQHAGISLRGVKASLQRTVIRDTRTSPIYLLDLEGLFIGYGQGMLVRAGSDLQMRDCLVANNAHAGVRVDDSRATIERSVVRSTRPGRNGWKGYGVWAGASSAETRSRLIVRDSLLTRNRSGEVGAANSDLIVERTVIKDSGPGVVGKFLGGVDAAGWSHKTTLVVRDCLIVSTNRVGIAARGADIAVSRTVVRDTRPTAADKQRFGIGIYAGPYRSQVPLRLSIDDCLVAGNRTVGVMIEGYNATVARTVIRDTAPQASDHKHGIGLSALEALDHELEGVPAPARLPTSLTMTESVVARSRSMGIHVGGSDAILKRVVVRDTRPQARDREGGIGVTADRLDERRSSLIMDACVVRRSRTAGIAAFSSTAAITRSLVDETLLDDATRRYGEGIGAFRDPAVGATKSATLDLRDSLIERSAGAGLLYYDAGGSAGRSVFRRGTFSIDLERGANPELGPDNRFELNKEDRITWGQELSAPPIPPPPPPPLSDDR